MMNRLRIFIALFLIIGTMGAMAQTSGTPVASYPIIESKLKKTEKDLVNPKKNITAKYWLSRAGVMMDAYDVNLQHIGRGAQELQMNLMFGDPTEKRTESKDGKELITHVHERINITYEGGVVVDYEETKPMHDNPLPIALEALEKAEELDVEKKSTKKIAEAYDRLSLLFERQAGEKYMKEDFEASFKNFEASVIISQKAIMEGAIDTAMMFNAGMTASKANLDDESIKYYELAVKYNYPEPDLYIFLPKKYLAKGDSVKAVEKLSEGFEKYPDNQAIVIELVNFYLLSGKSKEALEYIKIAQEKEPENPSLLFAEGVLYDKKGELDKAIEIYQKTIEIDEDFFNGHYNLGVAYYNRAQKYYDEANDAPNSEYKGIIAQGDEVLAKAIPYFQKCYELDNEEVSALENLKQIYFRLRNNDPMYMDKYNEIKAQLEQ